MRNHKEIQPRIGNSGEYGLPPDYECNPADGSFDPRAAGSYWTHDRLALATRYQWGAYKVARKLANGGVVVDLGCGPALKLNTLFGESFELYGVDQPSAAAYCQAHHRRGTYLAEDFDAPRFVLKGVAPAIDVLIASDVIEHLAVPDRLLAYIFEVATPATQIVLSTPDRAALLGAAARRPENPAHVREWTRAEFGAYLTSRGLRVVSHQNLLPFRLGTDRLSVKFALDRLRRRLPPRTCQVAVCRVPEG